MKILNNIYQGADGTSIERELTLLKRNSNKENKTIFCEYTYKNFKFALGYNITIESYIMKFPKLILKDTNKADILRKISQKFSLVKEEDIEKMIYSLWLSTITSLNKNPNFYYKNIFSEKYRKEFAQEGIKYIYKNYKENNIDIKKYPYNRLIRELTAYSTLGEPDNLQYLKTCFVVIYFLVGRRLIQFKKGEVPTVKEYHELANKVTAEIFSKNKDSIMWIFLQDESIPQIESSITTYLLN